MSPITVAVAVFILNLITIIIAMMIHAIMVAKWASKMETTLNHIQGAIKTIVDQITKHSDTFFTKEEAFRQIYKRDDEIKQLWQSVNEIRRDHNGTR
jgi:uncharacterized protein YoxC